VRLDQRLRALRPDLSWTRIREAITHGQVTVDGVTIREPAALVDASAEVHVDLSRPRLPHARLDLSRLYEDEHVLVVDKPAGLLSVPTDPEARDSEDTVLRRVREYVRHLRGPRAYAGALHRLDRDTSGALAVALSREAHREGRASFAAHAFERWYLAVVQGVPRQTSGTIEAAISDEYVSGRRRIVDEERGGRRAVTHYRVRTAYRGAALLEVRLETGRQHQIRLHLQQLGHPLIGEKVYTRDDRRTSAPRQMLHAWRLRFPHPLSLRVVACEAPMPADMTRVLRALR
jgi:23S rRNA pseudouridine1911/1915/1917 synthase